MQLRTRCITFCKPQRVQTTGIGGATGCVGIFLAVLLTVYAACSCSCPKRRTYGKATCSAATADYEQEVDILSDFHSMDGVVSPDVLECTSQTFHA